MRTRSVVLRIARLEQRAKVCAKRDPACICFPEKERPSFGFPIEMEIADKVKCPLHGHRFTPLFHLYVPKWFRENLSKYLWTHRSAQYRKAWLAGFPPSLWPGREEETEDGKIFLKLKDGTSLLAYEPAWKLRPLGQ